MSAELLLKEFRRVASAPDSADRLRRFVVDLAVRGLLVEQDPADGDAYSLLAEAALPAIEGSRRSALSKEFPEADDAPYKVPPGWAWCRLNQVGLIVGGGTPPSHDPGNFTDGGSGIAWLTPADMASQPHLEVKHGARDLTEQGLRSSSATVMPKGTVLFTSRAPIGYVGVAAGRVTTNQGFKSLVPSSAIDSAYGAIYFRAFAPLIEASAPGTTFKEVSGKIVSRLLVPLPPLAEQRRIAATVSELMALCDQLDVAQNGRDLHQGALRSAALHRLTEQVDELSGTADTQFFLDAMPRFVTLPDHVEAIRQSVLELAIRGYLVPQDPSDEAADQLLNRLVKPDSIRRRSARRTSSASKATGEAAHTLRPGWCWSSLHALGITQTGGTPPTQDRSLYGDALPFIKPGDIGHNKIDYAGPGLSEAGALALGRHAPPGALLMVCIGASLGKCGLLDRTCSFNQQINALTPFEPLLADYLLIAMRSPSFQRDVWASSAHGTLPILNKGRWEQLFLPIAPLAEQHRIVAKVDELMTLCGELEAALVSSQEERGRLLESLLHEALNGEHSFTLSSL